MDKSDSELKREIDDALGGEPRVNAAQIGVTVEHGAVSLLGTVDTYAAKWAAEETTKRVDGVRTVAQALTIKLVAEHERRDSEIAVALPGAPTGAGDVPHTVTATGERGDVTLQQRDAAERAIRCLAGVIAVHNAIARRPTPVSATLIQAKIEAVLQRQAASAASSIRIDTSGGKVRLVVARDGRPPAAAPAVNEPTTT
jgi:osmotically-inducible protein OsmY